MSSDFDPTGLDDVALQRLAVAVAEQVAYLLTDKRSYAALDVARRHAEGRATDEELDAAARDAQAVAASQSAAWWEATRALSRVIDNAPRPTWANAGYVDDYQTAEARAVRYADAAQADADLEFGPLSAHVQAAYAVAAACGRVESYSRTSGPAYSAWRAVREARAAIGNVASLAVRQAAWEAARQAAYAACVKADEALAAVSDLWDEVQQAEYSSLEEEGAAFRAAYAEEKAISKQYDRISEEAADVYKNTRRAAEAAAQGALSTRQYATVKDEARVRPLVPTYEEREDPAEIVAQ